MVIILVLMSKMILLVLVLHGVNVVMVHMKMVMVIVNVLLVKCLTKKKGDVKKAWNLCAKAGGIQKVINVLLNLIRIVKWRVVTSVSLLLVEMMMVLLIIEICVYSAKKACMKKMVIANTQNLHKNLKTDGSGVLKNPETELTLLVLVLMLITLKQLLLLCRPYLDVTFAKNLTCGMRNTNTGNQWCCVLGVLTTKNP